MVVFRLFEKLRCSNERSTKFGSLYHEWEYLEEKNDKMVALQMSPNTESLYGLGRQAKKFWVCMEFCNFCEAPIWTTFR